MKIYLICPVRDRDEEAKRRADEYVAQLEAEGHSVHYPPRDVDQSDDGLGIHIIETHRFAMMQADEVHILWDQKSKGSHFDLGMAWMLKFYHPWLNIKYIERPEETPRKSFANVIIHLTENALCS